MLRVQHFCSLSAVCFALFLFFFFKTFFHTFTLLQPRRKLLSPEAIILTSFKFSKIL